MPELKNKVAIECSKPLTERGWEKLNVNPRKMPRYRKDTRNTYDGIAAAQQQAYFDKPLLIAELERLEVGRDNTLRSLKLSLDRCFEPWTSVEFQNLIELIEHGN